MSWTDKRRDTARRLAAVSAVVTALAIAGCGDDGDDGATNAGAKQSEAAAAATTQHAKSAAPDAKPTTPDEKAKASLTEWIEAYYSGDTASACRLMTKAALSGRSNDACAQALAQLRTSATKTWPRPKIADAKVKGRKAVVTIDSKDAKGYPVTLREENGQWKVGKEVVPGF